MHGDARISLEREPEITFDVLVLDAFSSDVIPIHLITREAMALYQRRLADNGILLMHISNRNLDLRAAVAAGIADVGMVGRILAYVPEDVESVALATAAQWVAAARDPATLRILDGDERWEPLEPVPGVRLWTDDYSNIFGVLNW